MQWKQNKICLQDVNTANKLPKYEFNRHDLDMPELQPCAPQIPPFNLSCSNRQGTFFIRIKGIFCGIVSKEVLFCLSTLQSVDKIRLYDVLLKNIQI